MSTDHDEPISICPVPFHERPDNCPANALINAEKGLADWRHHVTLRVDQLEEQLVENTKVTQQIKENTEEIIEFFRNGKGFFQVVKVVGWAAKWITTVGAAAALIWWGTKGGK